MPRGGARPGAGRKPKPLEVHRLRGTYRPARHDARAANVALMPSPESKPSKGWIPSAADLEQLDKTGRTFVADFIEDYDFRAAEGRLLLELGQIASRLAAVREARREVQSATEAVSLERLEQGWVRLFASLAASLKVNE